MDKELLYFQMKMLQAEIRMNAMIAENKWREHQGLATAYRDDAFMEIIEEYGIHHNSFPFREEK